jgi:hypothetical protein
MMVSIEARGRGCLGSTPLPGKFEGRARDRRNHGQDIDQTQAFMA